MRRFLIAILWLTATAAVLGTLLWLGKFRPQKDHEVPSESEVLGTNSPSKNTETPNFALIIGLFGKKEAPAVVGRIAMDTDILLLEDEGSRTCHGKTIDTRAKAEPDDEGPFLTPIRFANPCYIENYSVGVLDTQSAAYGAILPRSITDLSMRKTLEARLKTEQFFENSLLKSKNEMRYTLNDINMEVSQLRRFDAGPTEILNAVYRMKFNVNGPQAVLLNNTLLPPFELCSDPIKVFQMNSRHYLSTRVYCCECGWQTSLVFEILNSELKLIFTNNALSD